MIFKQRQFDIPCMAGEVILGLSKGKGKGKGMGETESPETLQFATMQQSSWLLNSLSSIIPSDFILSDEVIPKESVSTH